MLSAIWVFPLLNCLMHVKSLSDWSDSLTLVGMQFARVVGSHQQKSVFAKLMFAFLYGHVKVKGTESLMFTSICFHTVK